MHGKIGESHSRSLGCFTGSNIYRLYISLSRIREEIFEVVGKWWQPNAMFSLAQGTHSLFEVPKDEEGVNNGQTAFRDEIEKLANRHDNIRVDFRFGVKVEKIEKDGPKGKPVLGTKFMVECA